MGRRGEGTVYHRRDGRWSGQIRIPGGGRRTVYGRTEEEARERLAAVRSAHGPRTPAAGDTIPGVEELGRHRTTIGRLAKSERASNVRVFGSVARGDASAESDYDLVVAPLERLCALGLDQQPAQFSSTSSRARTNSRAHDPHIGMVSRGTNVTVTCSSSRPVQMPWRCGWREPQWQAQSVICQ